MTKLGSIRGQAFLFPGLLVACCAADFSTFTIQLSLQLFHLLQQTQEFSAKSGEPIFDSRRNLRKLDSLEYSGAGELTEAVGQNLGTDPLDVLLKCAWPLHAFGNST